MILIFMWEKYKYRIIFKKYDYTGLTFKIRLNYIRMDQIKLYIVTVFCFLQCSIDYVKCNLIKINNLLDQK